MSEWISVKQELPQTTREVLVYGVYDGQYRVGWSRYVCDRWPWRPGWISLAGDVPGWSITHWMPLPAPPLSEDKPTEGQ